MSELKEYVVVGKDGEAPEIWKRNQWVDYLHLIEVNKLDYRYRAITTFNATDSLSSTVGAGTWVSASERLPKDTLYKFVKRDGYRIVARLHSEKEFFTDPLGNVFAFEQIEWLDEGSAASAQQEIAGLKMNIKGLEQLLKEAYKIINSL